MTTTTRKPMQVSIVIPALDAAEHLPRLLQAIGMQTLLPAEVVIVDSSRDSGTETLVANWQGTVPLVYRRVGFAYPGHARNLGVALASSPWIAFLDCRTIPLPHWLAECASTVSGTGADFVRALLSCRADSFFKRCLLAATYGEGEVRSLPGSLVLKSVFLSSGGFLADVRAGEDLEWMRRLATRCVKVAPVRVPVLTYEGFPDDLATAFRKWHRNNLAAAAIDVCRAQKMIYSALIMMSLFLLVFRWNQLFANWKPWSPYYIPNITKIFVASVFLAYVVYRGLIRPILNSVSCSFLLPLNWVAVWFIGFCLDVAKAPGMMLGASILIRKRIGVCRFFDSLPAEKAVEAPGPEGRTLASDAGADCHEADGTSEKR